MGTSGPGTSFPPWVLVASGAYFAYRLLRSTRAGERKRREQNQLHTTRDSALLLLSALSVVGVLLCAAFIKPLNPLINSRLGIAAVILIVGGGLTYVFNRRSTPHP